MSKFIYLSRLNPLRLHLGKPNNIYTLKHADTDELWMQVITDLSTPLDKMRLQNVSSLQERIATASAVTDGHLRIVTFKFDTNGLFGCYRAYCETRINNVYRYLWSEKIHIAPEHTGLTLLQYRDVDKKNDVKYKQNNDGINIFSRRIEGGFQQNNYIPKGIDTVYMDANLRYKMLHSLTYNTNIFHAGDTYGIPDDVHKGINAAFGCDTVFIDSEGYTKYEGAEWTPNEIELYPFRSWTIELAKNGFVYDANFVPPTTDDRLFGVGYLRPQDFLYNDSFIKSF